MQPLTSFPGKRESESIIRVLHRHWFDILSHIFVAIFLALLLGVSLFLLPTFYPEMAAGQSATLFLFIENTFFLLLWLYVFLIWIDVWFDVWIITNERIVNIEQKGLFVRGISEISFSKVQDVTSEVNGIIPSVLNFGDVYVQSAGTTERFHFRMVPDPVAVKDLIMKLSQGAREDDLEAAAGMLKEMKWEKRA